MTKQVQVGDRFAPRTAPPDERSEHGSLSFVVWGKEPAYLEDKAPWKVCAAFRYLQEALDYIAYVQDRGGECWFQSPADCRLICASDRRVVCKVEGGAA